MKLHINNLEYAINRWWHQVTASRVDGVEKKYRFRITESDFIFNRRIIEEELIRGNDIIILEKDDKTTVTIDLSSEKYFFFFNPDIHNLEFTTHKHDLEWEHSGKVSQWKKEE